MMEKGRVKGFVFALSLMELLVPGFIVMMMTPAHVSLRFFLLCSLPLCIGLMAGSLLMKKQKSQEPVDLPQCAWMLVLPFVSLLVGLWTVIPLQGWLMVVLCLWAGPLVILDLLAAGAIRNYHRRMAMQMARHH